MALPQGAQPGLLPSDTDTDMDTDMDTDTPREPGEEQHSRGSHTPPGRKGCPGSEKGSRRNGC